MQLVNVDDKLVIANIFGQDGFRFGIQQTNIDKLTEAFQILAQICKERKQPLALPYNIGCFRGGADWNVVYKLIDEIFKDVNVTLYRWDRG